MGVDDGLTEGPERGAAAGGETLQAVVVEQLPSALFRVRFADGSEALAHVTARREKDFLRLLPGDRVRVRLSPFDDRRARILARES